jgi:hypothetical protein
MRGARTPGANAQGTRKMNRNPYAAPQANVADVRSESGNLTEFSKWVKWALYFEFVVLLVALISGVLEYQLLQQYANGTFESDETAEAAGAASDQRQMIVGTVQTIMTVVSGVLILMWIYRANAGARHRGAENMTFTPGWSVGWYFIPIANLFKPYQAMKEIWVASENPKNWDVVTAPGILAWWWFLWIVSNLLGNVTFRLALRAETLDALIASNVASLLAVAVDIPLIAVFIVIVSRIASMQAASQTEEEDGSGG